MPLGPTKYILESASNMKGFNSSVLPSSYLHAQVRIFAFTTMYSSRTVNNILTRDQLVNLRLLRLLSLIMGGEKPGRVTIFG